jgi:hypothetical protein
MQENVRERVVVRQAERLPRHVRVLLRLSRRELPEPVCQVAVERGIAVPAADGVPLLTDHPAGAGGHGNRRWDTARYDRL